MINVIKIFQRKLITQQHYVCPFVIDSLFSMVV